MNAAPTQSTGQVLEAASALLEIDATIIETAVGALAQASQVVVEPLLDGTQGQDDKAVYLASLHRAEDGSAELGRTLLRAATSPITIDIEKAITWFEDRQKISLAPEHREAIRRAVTGKFLVITGGPGTGKTTLVNGIIQILEKKERRILLAAPTGRAARRMTETTGREAKTIHRLLEFDPKTMGFLRDRDRLLEADLVIVDEASMIDAVLAYNLLKPCHPRVSSSWWATSISSRLSALAAFSRTSSAPVRWTSFGSNTSSGRPRRALSS